ncbi:hypothetical protein [Cohnella rhizosphaerae]|uniref:hypothetical protein n=1 Tax=Cohnella rhizosphaerae TaxID=1457232 RepID=UPI0030B88D01
MKIQGTSAQPMSAIPASEASKPILMIFFDGKPVDEIPHPQLKRRIDQVVRGDGRADHVQVKTERLLAVDGQKADERRPAHELHQIEDDGQQRYFFGKHRFDRSRLQRNSPLKPSGAQAAGGMHDLTIIAIICMRSKPRPRPVRSAG